MMKLFKPKTLSDSSLVCCLEDLRHALSSIDRNIFDKISFMNLESFLNYAAEFTDINDVCGKNMEELLHIVEPYIPLAISDKHIECFLSAAIKDDDQTLDELENTFVENSKIKFINNIVNMETQSEWEELVNVCRTIRSYKISTPTTF